jgi:tRNA nucleotidyltransferase (CCA-adding enzyme)
LEGDAISLAQELAGDISGKLTIHPQFNTAKIRLDKWSIDLTTCRSETYAKPGALPDIHHGSLKDDLFRRDFTVNAMAIRLSPENYGELVDFYGGLADIKQKSIRILHENSFIDDATRIWRAIRYEQRLDFKLEQHTGELLSRDVAMLSTVSGDRIRHEVELMLKENNPEKMLRRADELKVLEKLHPSLKGDDWLLQMFRKVRETLSPDQLTVGHYLAILTYRLKKVEFEQIISYLRLPRQMAETLRDVSELRSQLEKLNSANLKPGQIYAKLSKYSQTAAIVNMIVTDMVTACNNIELYLNKLHYIKPFLTGKDLQNMGITPGSQMQQILKRLHESRLNGKVDSHEDEELLVRKYLEKLG